MLHLGPRTFDELSGEVVQNTAFVLRKQQPTADTAATYYRLVDGKSCDDKQRLFLSNSPQLIFANVPQKNFEKIPGCPIGYWVSEKMMNILMQKTSSTILKARHGILTGNDNLYLRIWFELSFNTIGLHHNAYEDIEKYGKVFFPLNKGGERRRWYGNNNTVVKIKGCINSFNNNKLNEKELFFREGITWTEITRDTCFRFSPMGILFGHKGATAYFENHSDLLMFLAYSNSIIYKRVKKILFTGLSFTAGNVERMPYIKVPIDKSLCTLVQENISISKSDWDAHETSWDFKRNELVRLAQGGATLLSPNSENADKNSNCEGVGRQECRASLEELVGSYKRHWESQLLRLRRNEEELNREFIAIYGLEDELSPAVPLSEVTILQQGEIEVTGDK